MQVFQCKLCEEPCVLVVDDNAFLPSACPYELDSNWTDITTEMKEESKKLADSLSNTILNMSLNLGGIR